MAVASSVPLRVAPPQSRCGVRHGQVALMALCSFVAYALRSMFSVAIVAMVRPLRRPGPGLELELEAAGQLEPNASETMTDATGARVFDWSESVRGALLSAFFWGYMVSQIPGGLLAQRLGGNRTLGAAMLSTGTATLFLPLFAQLGSWQAVFANRVIQGVTQGPLYPSIYASVGLWAPQQERNMFSTIILAGQLLGPCVASFLCGLMAAHWGWPSIFYGFGVAAIASGGLLLVLGADSPARHKSISPEELAYIQASIEHASGSKRSPPVPWAELFSSPPLWSLWLCGSVQAGVFFTFLTNIPNYLGGVLKFDLKENGLYTSLPYIVCCVLAFVFTAMADYMRDQRLLSTTGIRKLFNNVNAVGCSVSMILMSYTESRTVCIVLLCIAMGSLGATFCGSQANFYDLSPLYAGPIFSIGNLLAACLGVIGPQAVGIIVSDPTSVEQWKIVFWSEACIMIVVTILYWCYGSGEVQPWNDPNYNRLARGKSAQKVVFLDENDPTALPVMTIQHIDGKIENETEAKDTQLQVKD